MKVLVTGGRNYSDRAKVFEVLDYIDLNRSKIRLIIHGCAGDEERETGADVLAGIWARERGVEEDRFPALWDWLEAPGAVIKRTKGGKPYNANAGPDRNAKMLALGKPDAVVGFCGGAGTANMIEKARQAGVRVWEVSP